MDQKKTQLFNNCISISQFSKYYIMLGLKIISTEEVILISTNCYKIIY